jgi:GntR family transcriptional regulator, phosphonate transport system regulatory protein
MTETEHATSGVALWRRVADSIEHGITAGLYASGEKLPAETEIAESYKVNRHTVRRALATLAERGLVRAERGSGTYVEARPIPYPLRARTRFSEIVGAGGREPRAELIASRIEAADRELARRLELAPGTELVRLDTRRFADRTPISRGTTWFPAARFPEAGKIYQRVRSVTRVLAHYGVNDYRRKSTSLTAALVDASDAALLALAPGNPVMNIEAVDVDLQGTPILTTRSRFAAERVTFVVES